MSHADNIDRVALVNRAPRRLIGRARGDSDADMLEPEVRVRPLSIRPAALRSRPVLFTLAISILLIVAVTVGFVLYSTLNSHPKDTRTPVTSNANDALAGNQSAWPASPTFYFTPDGHYHIVNKSAKTLAIALDGSNQLSNFSLTVTANQITGPRDGGDYYGVVIRSAQNYSHYYLFEISPFSGGQYEFSRFDGSWHYLKSGMVSSFHSAPGQSNIVTVEVTGNSFTFSVNNVPVLTTFEDTLTSPFTTGEVGLSVEESNVEVAFSHMSITKLS